MSKLTVLGAGGHAKVVIATALAAGWEIAAVLDDDAGRWGGRLLGYVIEGPCERALSAPESTCTIAIGANAVRRRIAAAARCRFATLVHPTAYIHDSVLLGAGTVVMAGAIVQPDSRLGSQVIVNTSASIDHDCVLGEAVHIAPGARLAGGVRVGDEALVGVGAVVIPSIHVGARTTVGAGAVVVRDLPGDVVAVGVPARSR
jgi:acetyltransferase EpsM